MIDPVGFEAMYAADRDPFGVGERWYERRKQAVVVASLARERYDLVWDCASGTGHLAHELLEHERCARLLASDAAPRAVALTRERLDGNANAAVAVNALPAVPDVARSADLVLVTEVLYYLPPADRAAAVAAIAEISSGSEHGEEVVSVHWRHHPHDAYLSGAAVTEELHEALTDRRWRSRVRHDDDDFVLASWTRWSR